MTGLHEKLSDGLIMKNLSGDGSCADVHLAVVLGIMITTEVRPAVVAKEREKKEFLLVTGLSG